MNSERPFLWFPFLVPKEGNVYNSVIGGLSMERLRDSTVVRKQNYNGSNSYMVFDNYVKLFRYIESLRPDLRTMHEVILGKVRQKPRFDIDAREDRIKIPDGETFDSQCEKLIEELIDIIIRTFAEKDRKIDIRENIVFFTSHGTEEGFQKRSYHIIIDGYCHTNSYQAEIFFKEIMAKASDDLCEIVDGNIYSKNHCMRLLWNHKIGSSRVKQYCPSFTYQGEKIEHIFRYPANSARHRLIQIFAISMISMTVSCDLLPDVKELVKYDEPTHVSNQRIHEAFLIISQYCNTSIENLPFKYIGVKKSCISVKRLKPSMCPVCERVHKNRPPFFTIHGNNLYWCCKGLLPKGQYRHEVDEEVDDKIQQKIHIGIMSNMIEISRETAKDFMDNRASDVSSKIAKIKEYYSNNARQIEYIKNLCPQPVLVTSVEKEVVTQPLIDKEDEPLPVPEKIELSDAVNPRDSTVKMRRIILKKPVRKDIILSPSDVPNFTIARLNDPGYHSISQEKELSPMEIALSIASTSKPGIKRVIKKT